MPRRGRINTRIQAASEPKETGHTIGCNHRRSLRLYCSVLRILPVLHACSCSTFHLLTFHRICTLHPQSSPSITFFSMASRLLPPPPMPDGDEEDDMLTKDTFALQLKYLDGKNGRSRNQRSN